MILVAILWILSDLLRLYFLVSGVGSVEVGVYLLTGWVHNPVLFCLILQFGKH